MYLCTTKTWLIYIINFSQNPAIHYLDYDTFVCKLSTDLVVFDVSDTKQNSLYRAIQDTLERTYPVSEA